MNGRILLSSAENWRSRFGTNRAAIVINPAFPEMDRMDIYDAASLWRFDKACSGMMRKIESR